MGFKKGNKYGGRKKGAKNRYNSDVREVFHQVYREMGQNQVDPETGEPLTGHQAMLNWAREHPTEFYRLYGKMIPATAELTGDVHEDFLDELILEEEVKLIDVSADVVDVGKASEMGQES